MKRKTYKIPEQQIGMFELEHPEMPVFDKSRCEARLINHETAARMVETYHYAHRVPSIVVAVGMFVDVVLAGVCTYGTIPSNNAASICGEEYKDSVLELTRLFIFDWCGKNSESWFISQSFNLIPDKYSILISYADTGYNHNGYIYQATNWIYTGQSENAVRVLEDGTILHRRTAEDPRRKINGLGKMNANNFEKLHKNSTRIIEKPKHRYVYFLGSKKQRKELRQALKWPVLPYPKEVRNDLPPT